MIEHAPIAMSFSLAMALGLVFGMGPCNISCLPYLGPVFLARDGGLRNSWRTIVPFSLGRLCGYTLLGLVAGLTGQLLKEGLESPWVPMFLGGATVIVGISLLFTSKQKKSHCSTSGKSRAPVQSGNEVNLRNVLPGGLFFMGVGMALNPCAPLGKVMLAASATTSAIAGTSLGLGFGLGAILIPAIVFGIGMAYLGEQLRAQLTQWRTAMEKTSAILLILMGAGSFIF